jgi:hypothetical protein
MNESLSNMKIIPSYPVRPARPARERESGERHKSPPGSTAEDPGRNRPDELPDGDQDKPTIDEYI